MVRKDREATREYNRIRAQKVYDDYKARRKVLILLLGDRCYLCGRAEGFYGLHLHHIEYHPTKSNYPKHSRSMSIRLKRLAEAEESPERFRLLCPKHHRMLESAKMIFNSSEIDHDRLYELLNLSDA